VHGAECLNMKPSDRMNSYRCTPTTQRKTPLLSRGGVAARQRKSCEATLARADGVVLIKRLILLTSTTPAAATASAFPSSAEEGSCLTLKLRETYKVSTIRGGIKREVCPVRRTDHPCFVLNARARRAIASAKPAAVERASND